MRRMALLTLAMCLVAPAWAQRPLRHVIFDLENGIEGWWGNVWGGEGTCEPSATDQAKFGSGALHCEVGEVTKGGSNTVSYWLPQDAEWRQQSWALASLWVRGDGSPYRARFTIEVGFEGEEGHLTYTFNLPLDSTEWRQIRAPLNAFWNRERVPMDVARIGRIMLGCTGTHSFDIDHIVLEARQRPVPLDTQEGPTGVDLEPTMTHFEDGRWMLRFDPTPLLPEPATIAGVLHLLEHDRQVRQEFPGEPAQDEAVLGWDGIEQDGPATLTVAANRKPGEPAFSARYRFDVLLPKEPPDPTELGLVPAPKQLTPREGAYQLADEVPVAVFPGIADPTAALRLLGDELAAWGLRLAEAPWSKGEGVTAIKLGAEADFPGLIVDGTHVMRDQGYILEVSASGAQIMAKDSGGLVNGVCTLLQAIESHYARTFELAAPAMQVVDWPDLRIRAVSIPLPTNRWGHPNDAPVDADFFIDFLRRTIVRQKLNMAVLIVQQAMQYDSHPKVGGPAAWPRETVKRIFDTLRRYGVEPVPCCNSLGHANWLAIPYKELAEDGDVHQFCTSNPDTKRILLEIYQEIVDLVEPKYFHIGMDEVRWNTEQLPEEERCKLCAGKDKRDIFAEWVTMLHDFFAAQGIEVMMWGDMVLPWHNGGPPYRLADTIDRLPKDIIICNWSTSLAHHSSHWFGEHGYERVIKSNSRGATLQEQRWCMGNMIGIWTKTSWLTEMVLPRLKAYTYLSQLEAAEYSWNFWPDLFNPSVPLTNEFFQARPLLQWRIAADPVAGAGEPEPLALPAGEQVEGIEAAQVQFGGLTFEVAPDRVLAPGAGEEASVEINRPVAALYFLHAAELTDREALVEALKASTAWEGIHIGAYEIEYASGERVTVPIRYPLELRDPEPGWCAVPVAYRALGVYPDTCEAQGMHLYAMQWINPRPDDAVATVALKATEAPAGPVLAALASQSPAQ